MERTVKSYSSHNYDFTLKIRPWKSMLVVVVLAVIFMISSASTANSGNEICTRSGSELSGLPSEGNYNYVTVGDVNKDGYVDIVTGAGGYPGEEPGGLYVYLNQKGQSFKDASTGLPGPGKNYFGSVQLIDIDKDSDLDIVASYESRWSRGDDKGIGIWLGNGGSGGTTSWQEVDSPVTSGSYDSAYCADIDKDGNLDIVGGSSKGLHVWKGSHSGSTLSWSEVSDGLPTSSEFTGVTLGDINKDGRLDLVTGSYNSQGISVYLCSSSGAISWSDGDSDTNLKQTGNTFDNLLIDLNSDSNLDLVSSVRGGVKAYLGNGNSGGKDSWWTPVSTGLPTSGDHYQLAVADVNGDGKLDIGCSYKIWENTGSMTDSGSYSWEEIELGTSLASPIGLAIGDLNNDLYPDIAGCGWGSGVKAYTLSLSSGSSGPKLKFKIGGTVTDTASSEPLAGVKVKLQPGGQSATTNSQGKYTFSVYNGSYTVEYSVSGYETHSESVQVSGNNVIKDIALSTADSDDKKDGDGGLPFMEIPIIAFALVIVIIIISKKKK